MVKQNTHIYINNFSTVHNIEKIHNTYQFESYQDLQNIKVDKFE